MADELTFDQLSRYTGEPVERLREWRSLGLIGRTSEYTLQDADRVRLLQACLRRGITAEAVARANEKYGDLLDDYLRLVSPGGVQSRYSIADAAELLGIDAALLRRIVAAVGFIEGDRLREHDIEALRSLASVITMFPEDAVIEGVKVYADSLARVAEMETRLYHFYVHGNLKTQGLTGTELMKASRELGDKAKTVIEPAILFFHQLGWERAQLDDLVLHMAEEAGLLPELDTPGELLLAVSFVDLSSFTPLTDAMGDAAAAEVLNRFSEFVRHAAGTFSGRVVKQIGDAFMLVFAEPRSALACALEIESQASQESQFPAVRAGIHWGTALYREGDYVGSNVNIASRLCTEAGRHQILVTDEVRKAARDLPEIEFVRLGKRKLKGLAEGIVLFEARARSGVGTKKHI
ncbi:MAG: adenylate/guanylate cyclase domain-containing protein, partial [bacterium]